mmetsp:Transcript_13993/g.32892  ORF Transcript_13993/g.32892 Transcript_13993/m.32892 type:complete len:214 (+) Transcript_13993:224-865(+)
MSVPGVPCQVCCLPQLRLHKGREHRIGAGNRRQDLAGVELENEREQHFGREEGIADVALQAELLVVGDPKGSGHDDANAHENPHAVLAPHELVKLLTLISPSLRLVHAPARVNSQTHVDSGQCARNGKEAVTQCLVEDAQQCCVHGYCLGRCQNENPPWCLSDGEHGLDIGQRLGKASKQPERGREHRASKHSANERPHYILGLQCQQCCRFG